MCSNTTSPQKLFTNNSNLLHINICIICHKPKYGEYNKSTKHGGDTIGDGDEDGIQMTVSFKLVV